MDQKLFNEFTQAADTFDFKIQKTKQYNYILTISALLNDKSVVNRSIVLGTAFLPEAIKRSLTIVNDAMREIAPGIKAQGRLTEEKEKIRLVPMAENEIARGIFDLSYDENDDYNYDCCDCYGCEECGFDYDDDEEDFSPMYLKFAALEGPMINLSPIEEDKSKDKGQIKKDLIDLITLLVDKL